MTKWHDRQASATIENDIAEMKRILKGKICEAKLANSEFTAAEFEKESQLAMDQARTSIRNKFFKSEHQMRQ